MSFDINYHKSHFLSLKEIINFTNDYYSPRRDLLTNERYDQIEELIKTTLFPSLAASDIALWKKRFQDKEFNTIKHELTKKLEKAIEIINQHTPKNKFDPINAFLTETSQFNHKSNFLKKNNFSLYKEKLEEFARLHKEVNEELELNGDIFQLTCLAPFQQIEVKKAAISKNLTTFRNYLNFLYDLNKYIIEDLRYELDISPIENDNNIEFYYEPIIFRLFKKLEILQLDGYDTTPEINHLLKLFIKRHIELFIKNNADPHSMLNINPLYLNLTHTPFLERLILYGQDINNEFNNNYIEKLTPDKINITKDFIYYGYTTKNENINRICGPFFEIRLQAVKRSEQICTESLKKIEALYPLPVVLLEIISSYAISILTIPHHCRIIQTSLEAPSHITEPPKTCCIIS